MKPIEGYSDYLISEKGLIFCISRNKEVKSHVGSEGYMRVGLKNDKGERVNTQVHRLIAISFISNPDNKRCVNHIDGNKAHNAIENLEWVTHSENTKHAFKIGLMLPMKGSLSATAKLILNTQTGIFYETIFEAAESDGKITPMNLGRRLAGVVLKNNTKFVYA